MKNPLPTVSQIRHVKHLLGADLFGPATIARLTGVPLRDVFRIARPATPVDIKPSRQYPPVVLGPNGKILGGTHCFDAARKNFDPIRFVIEKSAK